MCSILSPPGLDGPEEESPGAAAVLFEVYFCK